MGAAGKGTGNPDDLKIMIVSTPKTGNTWVKHLLSNVYDLPIVRVGKAFSLSEVGALGPGWIIQQHYTPHADLLEWAKHNSVVFLTTVRHPCDVLVSLFHFVRKFADQPGGIVDTNPARIMLRDGSTIGEYTASYVTNTFFKLLYVSLQWMYSTETRLVYYEDLQRDPVAALQSLTASIREVSLDCIEHAVEFCNIDAMRKRWGRQHEFFRSGSVGDWQVELPQQIVDILRYTEPYPAQFAALGYTLEPGNPSTTLPREPRVSENPFRKVTHFDNGVPIPLLAVELYLSLDPSLCKRWPAVERTACGSFYSWLNSPADQDPQRQDSVPIVTNLAHYIYRTRPDVRSLCPDAFGKDRLKYVTWFILNAQAKYGLDHAFVAPMRETLLAWSNMPAREDRNESEPTPVLTNLAVYIYHLRPDLQAAFPDLFGDDRLCFARWFVNHARSQSASNKPLAEPIRSSEQIIFQSLPEASNVIRSLAFSLRRKLLRLVRRIRSWVSQYE